MNLIQYQIDAIRNAAAFVSTRWKARARVVPSITMETINDRARNEQQERDRPDDRVMERNYYPEREPEQRVPEYPFQDFNYGP